MFCKFRNKKYLSLIKKFEWKFMTLGTANYFNYKTMIDHNDLSQIYYRS